jgi:hypothetical protein
MSARTILVPVDGASNIKLETLDFETLATVHSKTTETPVAQCDSLAYNATGKEFDWFDSVIQSLSDKDRAAAVVAPVARGASGGLIGADNTLMEVPGQRLTLAYTQGYPETVNEAFAKLGGSREEFFQETGSIRDFPGSLTLLKRLVFEELVRPQLFAKAAAFGQYGALMGGHFIGDDYLAAIRQAGNEHSYWMCHTGTRDVRSQPGTPSKASRMVKGFQRLVPAQTSVCYKSIGIMPAAQAKQLKLLTQPLVISGGHDTCLSHLPILSTFYQAYPAAIGKPVVQVEAGTWTMIAQMGGVAKVPGDGYTRDIIIQGTVDGEPVVTARYGGGADFSQLKKLAQANGCGFNNNWSAPQFLKILKAADSFVLPNIAPSNHCTGPFPQVKGRIINEAAFFADGVTAYLVGNLMTVLAHSPAGDGNFVRPTDADCTDSRRIEGFIFCGGAGNADRPSGVCDVRPERSGRHRDDHARSRDCRQGGMLGRPSLQSGHGCAGREISSGAGLHRRAGPSSSGLPHEVDPAGEREIIDSRKQSGIRISAHQQSKRPSPRGDGQIQPGLKPFIGFGWSGPLSGLPVWRRPGRACRCNRQTTAEPSSNTSPNASKPRVLPLVPFHSPRMIPRIAEQDGAGHQHRPPDVGCLAHRGSPVLKANELRTPNRARHARQNEIGRPTARPFSV